MILPPPRSTLFPYTTPSDLCTESCLPHRACGPAPRGRSRRFSLRAIDKRRPRSRYRSSLRSEEHTSELQSLTNLVCRLLLEKKKKKQYTQPTIQNNQST